MRTLSALSFTIVTAMSGTALAQIEPIGVDPAAAEEVVVPGETYVERGLTLPQRTLRVDLGPYEQGINNSGFINGPQGSQYGLHFGQTRIAVDGGGSTHDGIATMGFGVSYGILDELEVGANLIPIAIDSRFGTWSGTDSGFANLTFYGRYSFLNSDSVQIGAQLAMSLPTGVSAFGMGLGLPVNFNLGKLRLETGFEFEMFFQEGDELFTIDIPIAATVSLGENAFVGGHLAITLANLSDLFLILPLGAHGGYSFRGGAVDADITATFSYSIFTNNDGDDGTRFSEWTLGVGGTLFFPL